MFDDAATLYLTTALAAPVAGPVAGQEPVLWYDASAAPHEDQGSLPTSQGEAQQIAILGSTKGPFGSYTTPLFAAAVPAASVQPDEAGAVFVHQLIDSGAENYIGQVFGTERGDVEVIARYVSGKTPQQKLAELEAKQPDSGRDAALAAAIMALPLWGGHGGEGGGVFVDDEDGWLVDRDDVLAALAAHPANVAQAQAEQRQRERMTQRFADRKPSAATADFDLPAPNDAIDVAQPVSDAKPVAEVRLCREDNFYYAVVTDQSAVKPGDQLALAAAKKGPTT